MALILCRLEILFVLLNLGASVTVDSSNLPGVSTFAEGAENLLTEAASEDSLLSTDVHSEDEENIVSEAAAEDSLDSPDLHSKDEEILPSAAPTEDSMVSPDLNSKDPVVLQGEAAAEDSRDSPEVHSEDQESLMSEGGAEDSLDSPELHSEDPENFENDSAETNSLEQVDAYSNVTENLVTDMVDDVVHDMLNGVTSLSQLAPEKGDAVPPFPITFPGCNCEWNEVSYSCENDILAPDSMAGQPCCCCGLKCDKDHRCSNNQCLMIGFDQQKEMEEEEKRIAELLNRSDFILSDSIPAFAVDLGKGQCTNEKIRQKCNELGLTPVCDHASYAGAAKVCWTNMQSFHWSQLVGRYNMRAKKFPIPAEFDAKSMGMCFMANYPHTWALTPTSGSHTWTSNGNVAIHPIHKGSGYGYQGPKSPSKTVYIGELNACSSELGCWRTLCVKQDPCSNCGTCGNPCGPCGTSNCPPPAPPPPPPCINGKTMTKKYEAKWPHCSNIGCFSGKSLNDRAHACLSNPACNGFSFTHKGGDGAPSSGGGCLKKNCEPETNGYGTRSHDYWVKEPCKAVSNQGSTECALAGNTYNTQQIFANCKSSKFPAGQKFCMDGITYTVSKSWNSVANGISGATVNHQKTSRGTIPKGTKITFGSCSGGGNSDKPQCASTPSSSSHRLVSGAWPCVKTGAPCKKVTTMVSNTVNDITGKGMENSAIGVTCCDAKGVGSRPGCKSRANFDQAVAHCRSHGLELCTAEQIKAGAGEATGCRFDHGLVWTCSIK